MLSPSAERGASRLRLRCARHRPASVRFELDAQRLLHASREAEPRLDLKRFKSALDRNQIDLIVERIEKESILVELLDHPIDFGQGFLFGEPKMAKAA